MRIKTGRIAALENNQHYRNMSILNTEGWVILVLAIILLIAGVAQTLTSFTPRVDSIEAMQSSMAAEIRQIQVDQAEMWQAIRDREIVEEIPDETIPPLASMPTTTATMISRSAQAVAETTATTTTATTTTLDRNNYDPDLVRIVALESDHSYEGALGVASVIYNRLADGRWGDTIFDVITAPDQFAWQSSRLCVVTDNDLRACQDAAAGKRNLPADCMWFCTPSAYSKSSFFRSLQIVDRFGGHVWAREAEK